MKKLSYLPILAVLASAGIGQSALVLDLSGNWNTSTSGNINYTLQTPSTVGNTISYNNSFGTIYMANGAAGVGGNYTGPNIYGAIQQYNAAGVPGAPTALRVGSSDTFSGTANTTVAGAGEFNFAFVVKKADFINGLNTGSIGFDSSSTFNLTPTTWTADSKSLRAVVQNGSTWYISQDQNTVATSGAKTITSNAFATLWAVWDPTNLSASSLSFTSTVAGSTFSDIQAVGFWASMVDGTNNPNFSITTMQVSAVAVPEPATWALLAGVGTFFMVVRRRRG